MARCRKIKITYEKGVPVVWLVWAERQTGLIELRSVSLTETHAGYAKAMIENEIERPSPIPVVNTWIEKVQAEHCFAFGMEREMMALARRCSPKSRKYLLDGD
jgi:hypothetical protein